MKNKNKNVTELSKPSTDFPIYECSFLIKENQYWNKKYE
jgi:hypothetical protein